MAAVEELWDGEWVGGKKTRRGGPLPVEDHLNECVTLIAVDAIDDFLHAENRGERQAHLRKLKADGILLTDKDGRLQQQLRRGHPVKRAYAFACPADHVPKITPAERKKIRPARAAEEKADDKPKLGRVQT